MEKKSNKRRMNLGGQEVEAELVSEIYLTRHGVVKQKAGGGSEDKLDDATGTVERLYKAGNRYRLNDRLTADDVLIIHSPMDRTLKTALAITAGALGTEMPKKVSDLENMVKNGALSHVTTVVEPELGYSHLKIDAGNLKKYGTGKYLNYLIQNPSSNRLAIEDKKEDKKTKQEVKKKNEKGKEKSEKKETGEVTTGNHMKGMGDYIITQAISAAIEHKKKYVVVASHGSIIEFPYLQAINSGRKDSPITDINKIGGEFHMEDSATLAIYEVNMKGQKGHIITIRRNSIKGKPIENSEEYIVDPNWIGGDLQDRVNAKEYSPEASKRAFEDHQRKQLMEEKGSQYKPEMRHQTLEKPPVAPHAPVGR